MAYATTQEIRDLTGLDSDEVGDGPLSTIRDKAERKLLRDLTISVVDETLEPDLDGTYINGTNNTFYTCNTPIADTNKDKTINSSDITIYEWGNKNHESTKSEVSVSSVSAKSGLITLDSAPSKSSDKVTADYSYYLSSANELPDWDLVNLASIYLSGYLGSVKARGKVPSSYTVGKLKVDDDLPGSTFLREYRSILNDLRDKISS